MGLLLLIVAVVILAVLFVNYFLVTRFGFTQQNFIFITAFLLLFGLSLFWFLSLSVFEHMYEGEGNLKQMLQKTLHELNTPVSTIQINAKMLGRKLDDDKSLQKLGRIQQASSDLLGLYDQMEYAIKKQVQSVETEHFDLCDIVDQSIERFADVRGDIRIFNEISRHSYLQTDKQGFAQVIDNLLSNAIKYNTSAGSVVFAMEGSKLTVSDTGRGIDTKNLFVVFDSYYQEDSSAKGFGMGLAVVKAFCDKHKISIHIDSREGRGSRFILDLKQVLYKGREKF
ncbi:MAG: sensor histidine kinase [Campylobacterota bacterium]